MDRSSIRRSLIAVLCLAALASSWAPHIHVDDGHGGAARSSAYEGATLASDDAHHEHSSTQTIDIEICLACRSNYEGEVHRSSDLATLAIPRTARVRVPFLSVAAARSLPNKRHAARAPPAQNG